MHAGAVERIMDTILLHMNNVGVAYYGCGALGCLAFQNKVLGRALVEAGAHDVISEAMRIHSGEEDLMYVCKNAMVQLPLEEMIDDDSEIEKVDFAQVASQAQNPKASIARWACRKLRDLAKNAEDRRSLMKAGAGVAIMKAIRVHGTDQEIARLGHAALCELAADSSCYDQLVQIGAGDLIAGSIGTHSVDRFVPRRRPWRRGKSLDEKSSEESSEESREESREESYW
mmetsp:Transcript_3756/g.6603  ORF Transcript_3756/g.6603 Transcript_3756/m.6603 type:complete len:229 (-) Transcript_3756:76-762(-)